MSWVMNNQCPACGGRVWFTTSDPAVDELMLDVARFDEWYRDALRTHCTACDATEEQN